MIESDDFIAGDPAPPGFVTSVKAEKAQLILFLLIIREFR
jgi:hypothetical protein